MNTIFAVEDNQLILDGIREYFEISGFAVEPFTTLRDLRRALERRAPDLIILDVMLPDGNGFHFAKQFRQSSGIPIIFLTAKEEESDRIMGFEVGGDDYVVKPFSNKELLLRVRALLRRSSTAPEDTPEGRGDAGEWHLHGNTLRLDKTARRVYQNGEELSLTASEWNLLSYLTEHAGQAVSRDTLLGESLGYLYSGSERTVDTHIANLRGRLGKEQWIETVRSFGYRFAGVPSTPNLSEKSGKS